MGQLPIGGLADYNTAASAHRNWADNFGDFFAGDARSVAGKRDLIDGKVKANWWDRLMNKSTEELTNAKMKLLADQLRKDPKVQNIIDNGGKVNINDSRQSIVNRDKEVQEFAAAMRLASAEGLRDKVKGAKTADEVYSLVQSGLSDRDEKKSNEIGGAKWTARQEGDRYNDTQRRLALQDERLWLSEKEGRLNRAQEMRINAENNAMQMQLEYSRLDREDRRTAQDRKDKAVLALLTSLGNLGSFLTI